MKTSAALAVIAAASVVLAAPHGHGHVHGHVHARDDQVLSTGSVDTDNSPPTQTGLGSSEPASAASEQIAASSGIPAPGQTVGGADPGCTNWYTVVPSDTCNGVASKFGITLTQLYAWNPSIHSNCDNLWAQYDYCVGVGGTSASPVPVTAQGQALADTSAIQAKRPVPFSSAPASVPTATPEAPDAPAVPEASDIATPPVSGVADPTAPSVGASIEPAPVSGSASAPTSTGDSSSGGGGASGASATYTSFHGDGSTWPSIDQWASFDTIWNGNLKYMQESCVSNGWGTVNNSPQQLDVIRQHVDTVAKETNLDPRFILSIILQESWGCVYVITTNGGVSNPGLMQDHNGQATCVGQTSCSDDTIKQMIDEGTKGTLSLPGGGAGLIQCYEQAGAQGLTGARQYYGAARIYNSGSMVVSDLGAGGATHAYSSDVANKLIGHNPAHSSYS